MTEIAEPVSRVESQSHETAASVSPAPWLAEGISRATYYRRRAHKSENAELNNGSRPDNNFKSERTPDIPPQSQPAAELNPKPQLNPAPPVPEQTTILPQTDAAAEALKKQIEELRKSEQLIARQKQQQTEQQNYIQQLQQVFHYWKNSGLSESEEKFLLAYPAAIPQLTQLAGAQAAEQGHAVGSAEHTEATTKLFHQHLEHLQEQARQYAPAHVQQAAEPTPIPNNQPETAMSESPPFFAPPKQPERRVPVSAPVSRTVPDGSGSRFAVETNPSRVTLTADEKSPVRCWHTAHGA
jgi:hypothetical protein